MLLNRMFITLDDGGTINSIIDIDTLLLGKDKSFLIGNIFGLTHVIIATVIRNFVQ